MTKKKICVQLMTVSNKIEEIGVYETLRKLHDLGFTAVEVSSVPMTPENVAELKRGSKDFGIEIAAISAVLEPMLPDKSGETLENDFEKIVNDCKELSCKFIRMGILPLRLLGHKDKVLDFARRMEKVAERLKDNGIDFYFHTHHYEFQKLDGEYILDLIKYNTEKLGFELDVHWIQRAGENPIKIIKQYKDRIALLHLKDYRIAPLTLTEEDFKDSKELWKRLGNIVQFAELGEGNLDLKSTIEAGLNNGARYFIIEQDETYGRDPFDSLAISAKNLKELGYSYLF